LQVADNQPSPKAKMLGFGKSSRDHLADAKSVDRWLATFPDTDPLATQRAVVAELAQVTGRESHRTPARLDSVFHLDSRTVALRKALTAQYVEHANRSVRIEQQLWSALFDLTQAFLVAYQSFAGEVSARVQSPKWQLMLPELIARQVIHLGLDAKTRLFRYEQWIPAKWAELHALFTLASSRQVERHEVMMGMGGGSTTIEQEYMVILLLQLMNSGNMTARHLEWVAGEIEEWCSPLRFMLEASSVTSFYVDLSARVGLKRRPTGPLEGRVLFLDTRPLHEVLMQNVIALEQRIKTQPMSQRTPDRAEQLNLLVKLASQVDPDFKPFARRGERTAAAGTVDAIVGFGKICGYLKEEERDPIPHLEPGMSFGGAMELAVFGHLRNERDKRVEMSRRRLSAYAAAGGPWDVKDVSQTGFRLISPMSAANAITLGTLAAIRAHGDTMWTLGIVRRMRRLTSERAEVGLQVIAHTLVSVDLIEQRKRQDADYSVDGEATTISGRTFQGLFLSLRKRDGDAMVQSLIVPAAEFQPAKRLKLMTMKSIDPVRYGRLIEHQPEWVWATVEPLALTTSLSPATQGGLPPIPRPSK
jgi:hypothetical protein